MKFSAWMEAQTIQECIEQLFEAVRATVGGDSGEHLKRYYQAYEKEFGKPPSFREMNNEIRHKFTNYDTERNVTKQVSGDPCIKIKKHNEMISKTYEIVSEIISSIKAPLLQTSLSQENNIWLKEHPLMPVPRQCEDDDPLAYRNKRGMAMLRR